MCVICPKTKQNRLSFPSTQMSSIFSFELIHVDTWGPHYTKTQSKHRYFLTMIDDFTSATWAHLMVTKDEALSLIKCLIAMAKTQFEATIKTVRLDNALELGKSYDALEFFAKVGVMHQTSCIQNP